VDQVEPTREQTAASRWHTLPSTAGQTSVRAATGLALCATAGWLYLLTQSVGLATVLALVIAASGTILAGVMATFAYGYYSMRYDITGDALVISTLWVKEVVPLGRIEGVVGGKRLGQELKVQGISWRGLSIGKVSGTETGPTAIYATGLRPSSVVVIATSGQAYAITPADVEGFRTQLIRRLEQMDEAEFESAPPPSREGSVNPAASLLEDRLSVAILAASVAVLAATFVLVAVRLPGLPPSIALHLGPTGAPDFVQSPSEAFRLPIAGLVVLAVNCALAVALHIWRWDTARVLAGSTFFVQLVGLIAVLRVVQ
jgi:hypothetical protein